jgi:hypothetical protein
MVSIIKKILNITAKVILGIFLLYLFICLVAVPIGLSWGIRSQGTKFLKHQVQVRSVLFNPFLLRLSINGFKILDKDKQVMAGFDKFSVNVSFVRLFKKEYRVESIALDGLKVNAVLMPGGKINLLDLVPQEAEAKNAPAKPIEQIAAQKAVTSQEVAPSAGTKPSQPAKAPAAGSILPKNVPLVIVDSIIMTRGTVNFLDKTLNPNFSTSIHDMDLRITGVSTKPDCRVKIVYAAKLDEKGVIATEALFDPFIQPLRMEVTFSLDNYALQVTTPYVGKYTGHAVGDGKMDLKMTYLIADNKLTAKHKLLIQHFDFGKKVESKDALNLPFGLAIALLEDPNGRINISLPASGDMSDPKFKYNSLIFGVVKNFFLKLVTSPFMFMAQMLGGDSGTEELGLTRFTPGKSDLSEDEQAKLKILVKGLLERPKLRIEVNGTFDPVMDWQSITTEIFNRDFKVLMKQPKRTEASAYQELYQKRFGIMSFWKLTKEMAAKSAELDPAKMNEELKRRIIETPPSDKTVFKTIADARAKKVYDFMAAEGFSDSSRIGIGPNKETQGSMGFVPIEFTMTVFEKQPKSP